MRRKLWGGRAMRRNCTALFLVVGLFAFGCGALAQTAPTETALRNPLSSDASIVRQGAILFRQECIYCHGPGARGGSRGPDLTTGNWTHGGSDAEIFKTVSTGVPGTAMPANHLDDNEIWKILTYLRSLQQPPAPAVGNAAHGCELFFGDANCSLCHMVAGRGGRLGPELSRVGSARSRLYLIDSIREPDKDLTRRSYDAAALNDQPYDTVTAITRAGKTVTGVAMNEDTFTVQIMDASENVYSFEKKALKSLKHERKSMMPAYKDDLLSDKDLQDIVSYLQTLRSPAAKPEKGLLNAAQ